MTDYAGRRLGNYQLISLLGKGGYAEVYLGEQITDKAQVAVKILRMRTGQDEITNFLNEARTIRLKHPHIITLLDFNVEEEIPYLVMEYMPNGTLRQRHPRGTRVSLETVLNYTKQLASALEYAHKEKLIHRDIKPENILIGLSDELKLSDFGIVTIAHNTQSQRTQEPGGTPYYMAPEQIEGYSVPASDQYSLGIVVYEWLCGSVPFEGSQFPEIAFKHLNNPVPSLHDKEPSISLEVENVVLRALAKKPKDRFNSVQDFIDTLEKVYEAEQGNLVKTIFIAEEANKAMNNEKASIAASISSVPIGTCLYLYEAHNLPVNTVAWSPDGKFIASGDKGGGVHIWYASTGLKLFDYYGHKNVKGLLWHYDSDSVWSAGLEGTVQKWSVSEEKRMLQLKGFEEGVFALDSKRLKDALYLLVATGDGDVIMYTDNSHHFNSSIDYSEVMHYRSKLHSREVLAVSFFGQEEYFVSGGKDKVVQVCKFDPENFKIGDEVFTYYRHTGAIKCVAGSPINQYVASIGEDANIVHIWDGLTGRPIWGIKVNHTEALAWSPDEAFIAVGNTVQPPNRAFEIIIQDTERRNEIFRYREHQGEINDIAWSPDGCYIASASADKTVHVWRVK